MTHPESSAATPPLGVIDVAAARADTPAAEQVVHVNNAGSSLPPQPVTDATVGYLLDEAAQGGYEMATASQEALNLVYSEAAAMFGCQPSEIAFQQGASQGWFNAFNSVPLAPGDRVLATTAEYNANALGLIRARSEGVEVELIPDDQHGQTSVDALGAMLDERVKLVCATHIPTSGGLINPVAEIGRTVKEGSDAIYLLDACQAAGQLPLPVEEIRCDFMAVTGRKFLRGPRGTGLLYVRAGLTGLRLPTIMDGWGSLWTGPWTAEHDQTAKVYELFEVGFAAKVGIGVALAYANKLGLDNIAVRVQGLAEIMRESIGSIAGVIIADLGVEKSGIVTFDVAGVSPDAVFEQLGRRGINTSIARPQNSQFDLAERAPNGLVRASVHYFNTEAEIARVAEAVSEIAAK